jgi:death-on-curing protein
VREIRFLSVADVIQIHANTIRLEGGSPGLRDHGLLDAAVAMPRQQFGGAYLHEDLAAMAAAYIFHLVKNHSFVDGNKRCAVMAAFVFLDANGVTLGTPPKELEAMIRQVAAGKLTKAGLIQWIRAQVSKKQ